MYNHSVLRGRGFSWWFWECLVLFVSKKTSGRKMWGRFGLIEVLPVPICNSFSRWSTFLVRPNFDYSVSEPCTGNVMASWKSQVKTRRIARGCLPFQGRTAVFESLVGKKFVSGLRWNNLKATFIASLKPLRRQLWSFLQTYEVVEDSENKHKQ